MSKGSIGPLLDADEFFNHQIVDTFATVQQSDYSWTEKVCGMAAARDGSLQIAFGFGKYTNRNIVDAYGGVSRGWNSGRYGPAARWHRSRTAWVPGPCATK